MKVLNVNIYKEDNEIKIRFDVLAPANTRLEPIIKYHFDKIRDSVKSDLLTWEGLDLSNEEKDQIALEDAGRSKKLSFLSNLKEKMIQVSLDNGYVLKDTTKMLL